MNTQVFVFGHDLRSEAKQWFKTTYGAEGEVRIHKAYFHTPTMDVTREHVEDAVDRLWRQGADFTGKTRTIICAPGMSVAALLFAAVLHGYLGEFVHVVNMIKLGPTYRPSPEVPVYDLQSIRNEVGRRLRARGFDGVERVA